MKRVNLQFDDIDYQRLQTVARAQGLKAGTFARVAVLMKVKNEIGPAAESETMDMFKKFHRKTKRGNK